MSCYYYRLGVNIKGGLLTGKNGQIAPARPTPPKISSWREKREIQNKKYFLSKLLIIYTFHWDLNQSKIKLGPHANTSRQYQLCLIPQPHGWGECIKSFVPIDIFLHDGKADCSGAEDSVQLYCWWPCSTLHNNLDRIFFAFLLFSFDKWCIYISMCLQNHTWNTDKPSDHQLVFVELLYYDKSVQEQLSLLMTGTVHSINGTRKMDSSILSAAAAWLVWWLKSIWYLLW